jgi:hypothetical protein
MNRFKMLVLSLVLMSFSVSVYAKTTKEHPLIRPFPGSILAENMSHYDKFNAYEFYYLNETTKKKEKKTIKGEYWKLLYEVRTPSGVRVKTVSKVEFFENYKVAASEKGGRVVFEDVGKWYSQYPGMMAESHG